MCRTSAPPPAKLLMVHIGEITLLVTFEALSRTTVPNPNPKSEVYRVSNIRATSTPITNVPIWLFPVIEMDLNVIETKTEWVEGEKACKASQ